MLAWISVFVGEIFLVGFLFVLSLMLFRPAEWIRFTELEHEFWVRRGFPLRWADAIKRGEQGWMLWLIVALCIGMALVLIMAPLVSPTSFLTMGNAQENRVRLGESVHPAQGFYDLGLYHDAWTALDDLAPEDKANPLVIMLRLDILLALHRLDDAVVLGTGACQHWPTSRDFFLKTASALIDLADHRKARDLLMAGPPTLHQRAIYWYDLALCHGGLGEIDSGRRCLWECFNRDKSFRQKALDDPDFVALWASLGDSSPNL